MDVGALFQTAFPIILTAVVGYLVARQQKKDEMRDRKEAERDEARKERSEKVEQINKKIEMLIESQSDIKEDCQRLNENQQSLMAMQEKIKTGLKISLQGDLLDSYNSFHKNNKSMTRDEYDHWIQTFQAYGDLNGNSFCDALNDKVKQMEIIIDDDNQKN